MTRALGTGPREGCTGHDDDSRLLSDSGDELTIEEVQAIRSLHRLARRWPQSLKLVSMGGSLHVIHTADERFHAPTQIERGEAVLDTIHGIPNDGGDW